MPGWDKQSSRQQWTRSTGRKKVRPHLPPPLHPLSSSSRQDLWTQGPACPLLQPWPVKGGWREPREEGPHYRDKRVLGVVSDGKDTSWALRGFAPFYA